MAGIDEQERVAGSGRQPFSRPIPGQNFRRIGVDSPYILLAPGNNIFRLTGESRIVFFAQQQFTQTTDPTSKSFIGDQFMNYHRDNWCALKDADGRYVLVSDLRSETGRQGFDFTNDTRDRREDCHNVEGPACPLCW